MVYFPGGLGELDRDADLLHPTRLRMFHLDDHLPVENLRVLQSLPHVFNRPQANILPLEEGHPFIPVFLAEGLPKKSINLLTLLPFRPLVGNEIFPSQSPAKIGPKMRLQRAQGNGLSILCFIERIAGDVPRAPKFSSFRRPSGREKLRQGGMLQSHHSVEHGNIHPLPFSFSLGSHEGHQNSHCGHQPPPRCNRQ